MSTELLNCDVVMKGGIASGVVYPKALKELASAYRFRGIGGTSAGAMAAAFAAAFEYGRVKGTGQGLEGLDEVSDFLGQKGNLRGLFQPRGALLKLTFWLLLNGRTAAFLLIAATLILVGVLWDSRFGPTFISFLAVALAGGLLAALVVRALKANHYGLCAGSAGPKPGPVPALTDWLHARIQALSGAGEPLTFGDLESCGIDLRLVTTNLQHGRPYIFPAVGNNLYYRSQELRRFFPTAVVDHMDMYSSPDSDFPDFRRLPSREQLPIVLVARASGGFPLLLSAVPLYCQPFDLGETRLGEAREDTGRTTPPARDKYPPELCLFSDGGICSNFPFHFFDKPLPSYPTFGLNLAEFPPDRKAAENQELNVLRAETNRQFATLENWCRFQGLLGFVGAIFNSAQNWRDNGLCRIPGYRDRIAHLFLESSEGGLNLDMPPRIIARLQQRGATAGAILREGFAVNRDQSDDNKTTWRNHCWIRFRCSLDLLAENINEICRALDKSPYVELLAQDADNLPSYKYGEGDWEKVKRATQQLRTFATEWAHEELYAKNGPSPRPRWAVSPELLRND